VPLHKNGRRPLGNFYQGVKGIGFAIHEFFPPFPVKLGS